MNTLRNTLITMTKNTKISLLKGSCIPFFLLCFGTLMMPTVTIASEQWKMNSGADSDVATGVSVWAQGFHTYTKQKKTETDAGLKGHTKGSLLGLESQLNPDMTIGLGYGYTDTRAKKELKKTQIEGHSVFVYGKYNQKKWYADWLMSYTANRHSVKQRPLATLKHNVKTYAAHLTTGYQFNTGLAPEAGIRYLFSDESAYHNGVQHIRSDENKVWTGVAGVKYQTKIRTEHLTVIPEIKLAATYDFKQAATKTVVPLMMGQTYQLDGKHLHRFGVEADAGVTAALGAWDFSLAYKGSYRRKYQSHTGLVQAKYHF